MTGKKKHVKFTYFEVVTMENDNEVLYDLKKWLYKITNLLISDRKKTVFGVQGRLESVKLLEDGIYAFNFLRMDESSDAYKAREDKKAEHIDLDDDEYLGRNTVAMYDANKHIILIQNNKGSYTPNAIQNYINATNYGEICYFRPILDIFEAKRCRNGRIKKIIARCSSVNDFNTEGSRNFERIIESCKDVGGYTFYIEIGIGRGKGKRLNNQSVYQDVNTLLQNKGCLSTAKVEMSDEQISGVYDLFDNLRTGEFDLLVPERGELDYIKIARNMYSIYINE